MTDKAKLIQLIHIAKSQLNIDDLSYRELLKRLTNKTSSTKCTVVELHRVLHELQTKEAKVKYFANKGKKKTDYSPKTGETPVKSAIAHKIRAVWIQMGKHGFLNDPSEKALNAYMRKVINKPTRPTTALNVGALDGNEASRFLEILKKWHKRVMMKAIEEIGQIVEDPKASYESILDYYKEVMSR